MAEKIKVSLIGLGSMGTAMAHRLLEQGFALDFWNRSARDNSELLAKGAVEVDLADALKNDFVISFLSNDAAALEVFSEQNLSAANAGTIHINMSTVSLEASGSL
ncbi:MAG: NAD(P)-binding domain-containing protein [Micrococcales bacterium]|nr:NAD(P)-binding domain-containing protein [Micrococcales bacterium]